MARKGKKRRQKQKAKRISRNYTKKEFSEVFCQTCLICSDRCDFCYNSLYKHDPKPFIYRVFNNLIDIHATYQGMGKSIKSLSVEQFENVVCRSGICFDEDVYASASCDLTNECYKTFMTQVGVENPPLIHEANSNNLILFKAKKISTKYVTAYRKKKKKKKARQVYASYPTFFSRDNAEFQAAIKRILYGDNDIQQDTDKELSRGTPGTADGHAEDRESKV